MNEFEYVEGATFILDECLQCGLIALNGAREQAEEMEGN